MDYKSNELDALLNQKSEFDQLLAERAKDGWVYNGIESTSMTPFNSETGKFEKVEVTTLDEIKAKYFKKWHNEVELVQDKNNQGYLVFTRNINS